MTTTITIAAEAYDAITAAIIRCRWLRNQKGSPRHFSRIATIATTTTNSIAAMSTLPPARTASSSIAAGALITTSAATTTAATAIQLLDAPAIVIVMADLDLDPLNPRSTSSRREVPKFFVLRHRSLLNLQAPSHQTARGTIMQIEDDYNAVMAVISEIADDGYRGAATEAIILLRTRRELGYADPGGPLAMRLRREAMEGQPA